MVDQCQLCEGHCCAAVMVSQKSALNRNRSVRRCSSRPALEAFRNWEPGPRFTSNSLGDCLGHLRKVSRCKPLPSSQWEHKGRAPGASSKQCVHPTRELRGFWQHWQRKTMQAGVMTPHTSSQQSFPRGRGTPRAWDSAGGVARSDNPTLWKQPHRRSSRPHCERHLRVFGWAHDNGRCSFTPVTLRITHPQSLSV